MKILIIIPARGGSKGIPRKNLVDLNGKPLIQYTLGTVKKLMENKTHTWLPFISTDDEEISFYCKSQGFDMEYRRPNKFSKDTSPMIDTIFDALKWLMKKKNEHPDCVLLLQPTSPLRDVNKILDAINKVKDKTTFSIISITRLREHPYECIEMNKQGDWSYLSKPIGRPVGRQQYRNDYFFIDGSFYFASISFLNKHKSFLIENKTKLFLLDQTWPIDIDVEDDLLVAETFLNKYGKD